ncbi:CaiB/BaiF CoA transferase family protein, partial [Plastoroseomonas hellenica]|uniref:CaiB/BaiF CoA transferase family protein n=1 Tax=Plastoroseomonas hellenica TaxID=2687306 RepID=UPI001BA59819
GTETSGATRLGTPIVDIATGLFSAIAILMALHEREKSGQGQYCDMTLHDCGMALLHPHAANFFLNSKRPQATGNPHPNLAPYSKFQTKTCEIFVAAGNDPAFRKFCDFLGMPEMAGDPRFATNGARVTNRDALTEVLNARFADEDGHALTRRMLAAGLPAGPVLNVDEAMAADHTAHRKMVTELGGFRGLGTPIKLSRTPGGTRSAPPRFNEHGAAVLRARGFSDDEIAALARDSVLVENRRK